MGGEQAAKTMEQVMIASAKEKVSIQMKIR